MIPGIKVSQQAQESIAAQREVVLTFDRLISEMSLMDRASVSIAPGVVSFLSDKSYGGSTPALTSTSLKPLNLVSPYTTWQKFVLLRHRNGQLVRREWPYAGGSALSQILPPQLPILADLPGVPEKVFAHGVEDFEVQSIGAAGLSIRLRSVQRGSVKAEACEINLILTMRGGV